MEKTLKRQRIIIIVLSIALIVCFFSLNEAKTNFENRTSNIDYEIQNLRDQINSIYSNVDEKMKEEASLITSFSFDYGDLDEKDMKVPVSVKVTPKVVSENTELSLNFGSRKINMKKGSDTEFTASFKSDLFLDSEDGKVELIITNGDTSETEELDWYISSLHYQYLPSLACLLTFDETALSENGLKVSGDVMFSRTDDETKAIKDLKLIFKLNNEILSEEDVSYALDDGGFNRVNINKTFPTAKEGDVFELLSEYEDEYGFIHRSTVKKCTCLLPDENTETETVEAVKEGEIILDKDGNILFNGENNG